jgi:hypothetical protein
VLAVVVDLNDLQEATDDILDLRLLFTGLLSISEELQQRKYSMLSYKSHVFLYIN